MKLKYEQHTIVLIIRIVIVKMVVKMVSITQAVWKNELCLLVPIPISNPYPTTYPLTTPSTTTASRSTST